MATLPYAVALCRRAELVLMSDGSVARWAGWLDDGMVPVYERGPDHTPEEALYVAFEVNGKRWASDIGRVEQVNLH